MSNIIVACLIIGVSIPLVMGKIPMNQIYGIRFKKSFASKENWYKINSYGLGQKLVHILYGKCPVLLGLLQTNYVKLFLSRPYGGKQLIIWSIPLFSIGIITFFLSTKGNILLSTLIACAPLIVLIPTFKSYNYSKKL